MPSGIIKSKKIVVSGAGLAAGQFIHLINPITLYVTARGRGLSRSNIFDIPEASGRGEDAGVLPLGYLWN